ncbi:hypothetical protein EZS27_019567 [termite gut metagenome]|uniref:Lipocalin-like domain-containing protein n=1 Tax=termite gut metagenome TaxID=433724 RepID=A0A5J4RFZ2_9ZZZZ
MKFSYLSVFALFFSLFVSCNQTDDLKGIFMGKTWKLTEIRYDNGDLCKDYWVTVSGGFDRESFDISYKQKAVRECFTLIFSGVDSGGKASGQYKGRATNVDLSGNWSVDSESRAFQTSYQNAEMDKDVLGRAFANAIKNAEFYSGDYDNLTVYFKEGQVRKYLLMHVLK